MGAYDDILKQINQRARPHRCDGHRARPYRNGDVDIVTCELDPGHEGPCRRGRTKWIDPARSQHKGPDEK